MARCSAIRYRRLLSAGESLLLTAMMTGIVACRESGLDPVMSPPGDAPSISGPSSPDPPKPPLPMQPPSATSEPPAPISGGTLLVTEDSLTAAAADPDRDAVWIVDTASHSLRTIVLLDKGAQPGRLVEDQDGMLHVVLRRGGQVVKIDPQKGVIVSKRAVCKAPRGLAYDRTTDDLHVACVDGKLVTMKARGGDVTRTLYLDSDLRDVVVKGDHLLVSRFRRAELLELDASGTLVGRQVPRQARGPAPMDPMVPPDTATPNTAWRMLPLPDGEVLMLHQRASDAVIPPQPGYYGPGAGRGSVCPDSGIVNTSLTLFKDAASSIGAGAMLRKMTLVVDIAASRDGRRFALISPTAIPDSGLSFVAGDVKAIDRADLGITDPCVLPSVTWGRITAEAQPIAGAFDATGRLWVQLRNPAELQVLYPGQPNGRIPFTGAPDRSEEGHRLFHISTTAMVTCASCHAEAGDDGHVWRFAGPVRTKSLRGGLLARAPFHWDGDLDSLTALMREVFTSRMSGPELSPAQVGAVAAWLDAQKPLPKDSPRDPDAVLRGSALFYDAIVGCSNCHAGPLYTAGVNITVGTGRPFKVPSLVELVWRAPYMHNGCAPTLRDRFTPDCGGDRHGKTSHLSSSQIGDLIAFLDTL